VSAYYFDSSALVKRYAQEVGSSWVASLTDPRSGNDIFTVVVSGAEIVAAVTRKTRIGLITLQDAATAIAAFKGHFKAEYRVVLINDVIVKRAMSLAEEHGLRGYDAIQLASALTIQEELGINGVSLTAFVCADTDLNKVAQTEGLAVENPLSHP
jgi:predicted nucleic acid-binding protein